MELLQLQYFQTVAQMESITKAANYYQIPQPAMSQMIARLERELGDVKLFDRRNNRLYLNEKGKTFLECVNRALMALDNGVAAVSADNDEEELSGMIRILDMENRRFVLGCLSKFSNLYPKVSFAISHDYYSDQTQTFDLCISSSPTYQQMHSSRPLIKEQVVLAVYDDHPLAQKSSVELSDLCNERLITSSTRSSQYAITCEKCRSCGFEPNIPIICNDPYFVRKFISEKMGIALAPALSWKGRFRNNTKLIPVEKPPIYITSYLIWDDQRYLPPAVTKFREYLIDEARSLDGNLLSVPE